MVTPGHGVFYGVACKMSDIVLRKPLRDKLVADDGIKNDFF